MKEINATEFTAEVLNGGKVILDFYSTECPPCEALASKFHDLSVLFGNDVKFIKIYRQGNRELSEKLGVKSSPTLLFFSDGKEVAGRLTGAIRRKDIYKNLEIMLSPGRVAEVKKKITPKSSEYDVLILGAGPGGLTAALYLGQSKLKTVLVDTAMPGGQVSTTHEVSNYPGFIQPQAGYMLSHNMSEQAKLYGTDFKVAVDITSVDLENKKVVIDEFETIKAKRIIIATGTRPNSTGSSGEKELKGKGISYCSTCDAKYYENKEVVVVGGGNSAVEESDYISRFADKITLIHQFDKLTAHQKAIDKLFSNPKIKVLYNSEPRIFRKEGDKVFIEIEDIINRNRKQLLSDGVFIFIGMKPNTEQLGESLKMDKWGFLVTNEDMQTNIPGVYAVGDVISKKYRQITTAVADGTIAAMAIAKDFS
ncbi:MAG TPA: FAD-dependent oxidoreductase [Bacteroidales bacterium]|nr:FAD-dependent oxidoreductase [Bacteroidales bacterium]